MNIVIYDFSDDIDDDDDNYRVRDNAMMISSIIFSFVIAPNLCI